MRINSLAIKQIRKESVDWLLNSGIQDNATGGVYSWYDPAKNDHAFYYPEITGYAISEFLFLYELEQDPVYLDRAISAADWILDVAWDKNTGNLPFRIFRGRQPVFPYGYSFDSGMVLSGLVQLAVLTNEERFKNMVVQIADWLCEKMFDPNLGLYCFWDPLSGVRLISPDKWSTTPWAFLTKVSRSLIEAYELTSDDRYLKVAVKVCEREVARQSSAGRFSIIENSDWVVSHPFLYSVEGLYLCGKLLNRPDLCLSAQEGLGWLANQRTIEGMIPAEIGQQREPFMVRSDVQAQFIRMALIIPESAIDRNVIQSVLLGLLNFSNQSSELRSHGGFQFAYDMDHKMIDHSNAWCTLFAIQALSLAEDWLEGSVSQAKIELAIRHFV